MGVVKEKKTEVALSGKRGTRRQKFSRAKKQKRKKVQPWRGIRRRKKRPMVCIGLGEKKLAPRRMKREVNHCPALSANHKRKKTGCAPLQRKKKKTTTVWRLLWGGETAIRSERKKGQVTGLGERKRGQETQSTTRGLGNKQRSHVQKRKPGAVWQEKKEKHLLAPAY